VGSFSWTIVLFGLGDPIDLLRDPLNGLLPLLRPGSLEAVRISAGRFFMRLYFFFSEEKRSKEQGVLLGGGHSFFFFFRGFSLSLFLLPC